MPHRRVAVLAGAVAVSALTLGACSTADPAAPSATPASATVPTTPTAPRSATAPTHTTTPTAPHTTTPTVHAAGRASLPVDEPAHGAGQVITVQARSTTDTTAVLKRWRRAAGGWRRIGPSVPANLGTDGMSRHASESRSATPVGSFTLTRAFGHDADPGTRLPYTQTTPDDWWISQPGPLYNTRQRCASQCAFTQGDPNEHLYYETPAYDYAVVIDYNTRNAPGGVRQGRGSAFFLHVSEGRPTAGCVSIPVDQLLRVLRWLKPRDKPRILIGTG
ncbi:L,D-transpeptidase [Jatrophihabitans endophyticus]|uniref:L,D-transpeptidase family protein n=1 Tax=Jatrophihabitans endophyticus TaxID=1206085 RepID=UPI0019F7C6B1|nr:L,D-transpeptidase family protein [Jatrophihabitans endophyticus]MBE7187967.1 hypothetical protein [Jatrophihabitans endophyticus]